MIWWSAVMPLLCLRTEWCSPPTYKMLYNKYSNVDTCQYFYSFLQTCSWPLQANLFFFFLLFTLHALLCRVLASYLQRDSILVAYCPFLLHYSGINIFLHVVQWAHALRCFRASFQHACPWGTSGGMMESCGHLGWVSWLSAGISTLVRHYLRGPLFILKKIITIYCNYQFNNYFLL